MGMCKPSGGVNKVNGPFGKNIKEIEGCTPNSRTDYYDEVTGELLQQRWYDAKGKTSWNRDWKHKDNNLQKPHKFPHDHPWDWSKKKPRQDYDREREINTYYC